MKGNEIEKIEISKKVKHQEQEEQFFYTGILKDLENDWIEIQTTRGEVLRFRKGQVQERKLLKGNENTKNIPI